MRIASGTAALRFFPTLVHDYNQPGRTGQAIHGCITCGQCFQNFDSINHFFPIGQTIIPGSSYWNIGIGRNKGEVEQDEEALRTMQTLGQNMAWLLKKLHA
jgi:multimeric flavodoxin WrbA